MTDEIGKFILRRLPLFIILNYAQFYLLSLFQSSNIMAALIYGEYWCVVVRFVYFYAVFCFSLLGYQSTTQSHFSLLIEGIFI